MPSSDRGDPHSERDRPEHSVKAVVERAQQQRSLRSGNLGSLSVSLGRPHATCAPLAGVWRPEVRNPMRRRIGRGVTSLIAGFWAATYVSGHRSILGMLCESQVEVINFVSCKSRWLCAPATTFICSALSAALSAEFLPPCESGSARRRRSRNRPPLPTSCHSAPAAEPPSLSLVD